MSLNVEVLERSFEKIKPHGKAFVSSLYDNLFQAHPEMSTVFSGRDIKNHEDKVLNSLVWVVKNLRTQDELVPVLHTLGARHVGYGATPDYYKPMLDALMTTFEQYLMADWTAEVQQAWLDALTAIIALMLEGANSQNIPTTNQ